ncbi:MAG: hypothetical protein IH612_02335 [Desulfofustis sp.]|nr:hypothetical protein [Desulfofustis sp.]
MEDIDKVLAYEIKKDIADRYFSFRKIIEQDSTAYLTSILAATIDLEASVGLDLIRLYILLGDPQLIKEFQDLTTIAYDLFYDPYICSSPTIKSRLFAGLPVKGLTRKSRFKHLFFMLYQRVQEQSVNYQQTRNQLAEDQETISEQIKLFYRKNDLQNILSFLRSLDRNDQHASLQTGAPNSEGSDLESKMHLTPPEAPAGLLPDVPVLPSLEKIKKRLQPLLDQALAQQPELDLKSLCNGSALSWRSTTS